MKYISEMCDRGSTELRDAEWELATYVKKKANHSNLMICEAHEEVRNVC